VQRAGDRALIKVGYGCNENCAFCHTLDVRHIDGEASEVHRKIERAKQLGHSMVVLSGGEPTIRKELLGWARHVASLGMDLGLVTNGRMLAYPELVERLIESRLGYVYLSMHGGTARVNDLMVRAEGAFDQTYAALRSLSGRGLDLTVNCVVTRHNLAHLRGVIDACLPLSDVRIKLSMVEPKGGGDRLFEHLIPRVTEVAAAVLDALEHARTRGAGDRVRHGGVPLCLLPGWEHAYDDLRTHHYRTMVEIGEPDFFPVDDQNKVQPEPCEGCALRGACPGLYRGYHEKHGASELAPRRGGARANSFDWTLEHVAEAPSDPGRCPIREDGPTPWDRGRHLFVRHEGKLARYRADTRDFADVEIDRIKNRLGHVYLDASRGKDAPDDFARDLVQLAPSATCAPCPERERCTWMYEPTFRDVFGEDDAELRAIVEAVEGDVLDVGCGGGPYDEVLAGRAASGAIRYVGVDPDGARVAALRARRPWARAIEVGRAEEIEHVARFDVVLALRSWNHFDDPVAAAERIVRALRPGGVVIVADDAPFGLARTAAQTRRARAGRAIHEHHRNDGPEDAIRALEAAGALRAGAARRGGSTLWWVEVGV
jgi:MoaA/NifB/PqqE/SkfB family radical SAM enzyme/SAM-dependent methyltransferase